MVELTISGETGRWTARQQAITALGKAIVGIFRRAAQEIVEDEPRAFYRLG
jgi:hypothetical protein